MKVFISFIFLMISSAIIGSAQHRVILDADIDSDVDDVEALAMVHTLADQKKIKLLGVIVTSDDPYAPLCVNAINTYFDRPNLPIGFLKNQSGMETASKYTKEISEEFRHKLKSFRDAYDATALYRKLLSSSPDSSVVIVTIGHLTSLQNLLQSEGDKYSSLSGKALVSKKVVKWICMGGMFPEGKEANFYRPDPMSTVYCLKEWNKQVIFCGWEVGKEIITGGQYLKSRLSIKSPVYRAYHLYNNFAGRPSWDQVAIFLLTKESENYFETITEGYCHVNDDGSNKWLFTQDNNHEYVVFKPGVNRGKIAELIENMAVK